MITVDKERCTGCGACMAACPSGAIRLVESETGSYAEVDQEKCRNCEACLMACPEEAMVSRVRQTVEGELVQAKAKPVPARPQPRQVRSAQAAPQALPLLGGARGFAGRELLTRVATTLLDAWDRRAGRPASAPSDSMSIRPARGPTASLLGRGGRQRRRRQRRGRR